jgi:hypothetical protein
VRTSPEPPAHGNLSAELTITDMTTGAPEDGLDLSIVPWMPSMGHGTSVVPVVTAAGNGKYVVTQLVLFMAGHWELRTAMSGAVSDSAVPALDLP